METSIIDITVWQLLIAYIFVLIVFIMLKVRGINKQRLLLWSSIRMTLQLIFVGYILNLIFDNAHPLITLGILMIMNAFAIMTIFNKFKGSLNNNLKIVIIIIMPLGTIPVILFFLWGVIGIAPYYNPQYFIPITGMIIGNSMTGVSLGIHTFIHRFKNDRPMIENALILGATPKEASYEVMNEAFDAAILPTINSMLGMGIIFLPGMMTGQILAGVDPNLAILYQIAIMLGILGGVSLTTYLFLLFGYRTFFNKAMQLVIK